MRPARGHIEIADVLPGRLGRGRRGPASRVPCPGVAAFCPADVGVCRPPAAFRAPVAAAAPRPGAQKPLGEGFSGLARGTGAPPARVFGPRSGIAGPVGGAKSRLVGKLWGRSGRCFGPDAGPDAGPGLAWARRGGVGRTYRVRVPAVGNLEGTKGQDRCRNHLASTTFCIYIPGREFRWSQRKRSLNPKQHGLDSVDAPAVCGGLTFTFEDDRCSCSEQRFVTPGLLAGVPVSIIHTETAHEIRIISFRQATRREAQILFDAVKD